jgi:hypothetical protein
MRLLRNIGKGAVSIVVIKLVLAVVGEEQVFEPVVVVVTDAHPDCPAGIPQARFFRYILECAIAIIFEEPVGCAGRHGFQGSAAKNENVHPAIVVVVEEGASAAHLLDDVGHGLWHPVIHRRGQAGACVDIGKG